MSAYLPDVNILLAFAWDSHAEHPKTRRWVTSISRFATCPITELGFVRVSMSPAYSSTFSDAIGVLEALRGLSSSSRIDDDFDAAKIPEVRRYKDTTDAYLVRLAGAHGMKLATFDEGILKADWASGVAVNPLAAGSP